MININFKQFFRDRIWFGWKCEYIVHLEDNSTEANWRHSPWIIHSFIPVMKNKQEIDHFKEDLEAANIGFHAYIYFDNND